MVNIITVMPNYNYPYYNYNNLKQNFSSPILNYPNFKFQSGHLNNLNENFEIAQNIDNLNNYIRIIEI